MQNNSGRAHPDHLARPAHDAHTPDGVRIAPGARGERSSFTSPSHYTRLDPEPIDVIERWNLDFCLGNALKYIARAGHKPGADAAEDLAKARWYVERAAKGNNVEVDIDRMLADAEQFRVENDRWHVVAREQRRRIEQLEKQLVEAGFAEFHAAFDLGGEAG